MPPFEHQTVLLEETVSLLQPVSGGSYIDCTLGGAGHAREILRQSSPAGHILGLDQDIAALNNAQTLVEEFGTARVQLALANFRNLADVARSNGVEAATGIVFDLGVSSPQFDEAERGFSYRMDAPLDMRMDRSQPVHAGTIVNEWPEEKLAETFFAYGEEKFSRRIAREIVEARTAGRIDTTLQLAEIVKKGIPAAARRTGGHPAKRVFQALRIAVNDELGALEAALHQGFELLAEGGRMALISFHSLEDRIVKQTFAEWAKGCICPPDFPVCQCGRTPEGKIITRKPVTAGARELEMNPRSRSAKLRVIERIKL